MKNSEKKEAAFELYMRGDTGNEISRILKVSIHTVSAWVTDGGWKTKRAERMATRKTRIDSLSNIIDYQLEAINRWIEEQKAEPKIKPIDKGEIDALVKLFSAVKGKELTWNVVIDVARELMAHVNDNDPELAKQLLPLTDDYLLIKREQLSN